MLFQPWDVWIEHKARSTKGQVYYARQERKLDQVAATRHVRDGSPNPRISPLPERKEKVILFDLTIAVRLQATAVVDPVTQDTYLGHFDAEATMGDIAGGSTWECIQLLRP